MVPHLGITTSLCVSSPDSGMFLSLDVCLNALIESIEVFFALFALSIAACSFYHNFVSSGHFEHYPYAQPLAKSILRNHHAAADYID